MKDLVVVIQVAAMWAVAARVVVAMGSVEPVRDSAEDG